MKRIVAVHSFRGGTGKSNVTANLAWQWAQRGMRVGVVDTDIQSPGIHHLFGIDRERQAFALNDYLRGRCPIEQAAVDVSAGLSGSGSIHLIPSRVDAAEITIVLRDGYDVDLLSTGFRRLLNELALDVLVIDTHPGLNEETLISIAIADVLLVVMRPDHQDYEGTGLTVAVARELEVPRLLVLVNKTPPTFEVEQVRRRVSDTYQCPVVAVLPHSDDIMTLASGGVFCARHPDHPLTAVFRDVSRRLLE